MEDISLHILDVVENSIRAHAKNIKIVINEDIAGDLLVIAIEDDGEGMEKELLEKVQDPFMTTKTTSRVGLGIPLFADAARMSNGDFKIFSTKDQGTKMCATFQHSHIDRKPWGQMSQTILTLIAGNPTLDFSYIHKKQGFYYHLDTKEWKSELENVPINHPEVIALIQKDLTENLAKIGIA